nr:uncharacterized PE-PGRS family protein PE_PGRS46-like [Aegilops tauschii subsp. strangulata]
MVMRDRRAAASVAVRARRPQRRRPAWCGTRDREEGSGGRGPHRRLQGIGSGLELEGEDGDGRVNGDDEGDGVRRGGVDEDDEKATMTVGGSGEAVAGRGSPAWRRGRVGVPGSGGRRRMTTRSRGFGGDGVTGIGGGERPDPDRVLGWGKRARGEWGERWGRAPSPVTALEGEGGERGGSGVGL